MWAAAEGHVEAVDVLIKAGAHVNTSTGSGFTAMRDLQDASTVWCDTPYGPPSSHLTLGAVAGQEAGGIAVVPVVDTDL